MSASLRIAVADDEVDMRDYLTRLLPRLGHQVVALAEDGKSLVNACRAQHPDLIITDVRMPALDGDAAVREIWRERRIPVILISAYAPMKPGLGGEDEGLCSYLNKPIRRSDLEQAIRLMQSRCSITNEGTASDE